MFIRIVVISPEVVSSGRKSIRLMTNSTLQHGLSEMFLVKLGFTGKSCWHCQSFTLIHFSTLKERAKRPVLPFYSQATPPSAAKCQKYR